MWARSVKKEKVDRTSALYDKRISRYVPETCVLSCKLFVLPIADEPLSPLQGSCLTRLKRVPRSYPVDFFAQETSLREILDALHLLSEMQGAWVRVSSRYEKVFCRDRQMNGKGRVVVQLSLHVMYSEMQ